MFPQCFSFFENSEVVVTYEAACSEGKYLFRRLFHAEDERSMKIVIIGPTNKCTTEIVTQYRDSYTMYRKKTSMSSFVPLTF